MRRFEFTSDSSAKFWSVGVDGSTVTTCWGRLGTTGQTKAKDLADGAKAAAWAQKLIGQKLKKGYVEVGGDVDVEAISTTAAQPLTTTAQQRGPAKQPARAPLAVSVLVEPGSKHHGLVLGLAVDGARVVAVGGQGSDLLFMSATGRRFTARKSPGPGLRSAYLHGDELWVCGEYGYVAKSPDRGKTWTKVASKARACLFGIVEDAQGNLWTAGDSGFVGVCRDRETFRKVSGVSEYIARISNSPLGVLVPTDVPGYLYVVNDKSIERCGLHAGVDLMYATVTASGTLVVVGLAGHVHRSTDAGKTFDKVKVPTTVTLTGVDCLADGRIVAVGDSGVILVSDDDGATFAKLGHEAFNGMLWCCKTHGDGMVIGGSRGTILRLGPS